MSRRPNPPHTDLPDLALLTLGLICSLLIVISWAGVLATWQSARHQIRPTAQPPAVAPDGRPAGLPAAVPPGPPPELPVLQNEPKPATPTAASVPANGHRATSMYRATVSAQDGGANS